jgi:hypothetical protein
MSRDEQAICGEIKATIAFVIKVSNEDTPGGPRGELVRRSGGSVRVTRVAKGAHMRIRASRDEEGEVQTGSLNRLRQKAIQKMWQCEALQPNSTQGGKPE